VTPVDDHADGRAALVTITDAGRAPLNDQRRNRCHLLAELLTALPAEEGAALTLAMHLALPIIGRLIHNAHGSRTQGTADRRARVANRQISTVSSSVKPAGSGRR
jgi:hypothetical protein